MDISGAAVIGLAGTLTGKIVWDWLKNRNGNGLARHNESASAHPDIREDLAELKKQSSDTHDAVIRIDSNVERLLQKSDS